MAGQSEQKPLRGFAAMKAAGRGDEVSAIARKGGKRVHELGLGYKFTSAKARAAGRKGGLAFHAAQRRRKAEAEKVESST